VDPVAMVLLAHAMNTYNSLVGFGENSR